MKVIRWLQRVALAGLVTLAAPLSEADELQALVVGFLHSDDNSLELFDQVSAAVLEPRMSPSFVKLLVLDRSAHVVGRVEVQNEHVSRAYVLTNQYEPRLARIERQLSGRAASDAPAEFVEFLSLANDFKSRHGLDRAGLLLALPQDELSGLADALDPPPGSIRGLVIALALGPGDVSYLETRCACRRLGRLIADAGGALVECGEEVAIESLDPGNQINWESGPVSAAQCAELVQPLAAPSSPFPAPGRVTLYWSGAERPMLGASRAGDVVSCRSMQRDAPFASHVSRTCWTSIDQLQFTDFDGVTLWVEFDGVARPSELVLSIDAALGGRYVRLDHAVDEQHDCRGRVLVEIPVETMAEFADGLGPADGGRLRSSCSPN